MRAPIAFRREPRAPGGFVAAVALGVLSSWAPASAGVVLSESEALERVFDGVAPERRTLYLTEEQANAVERAARSKLPSLVVTVFEGRAAGDAVSARAYLDTHVVRTMPATVLTVVRPDGTLERALVLQFAEPPDYLPRDRWLDTLMNRRLDDELWPGRAVPRVTGATLTVHSLTQAVRRSLAIDEIVVRGVRDIAEENQ